MKTDNNYYCATQYFFLDKPGYTIIIIGISPVGHKYYTPKKRRKQHDGTCENHKTSDRISKDHL